MYGEREVKFYPKPSSALYSLSKVLLYHVTIAEFRHLSNISGEYKVSPSDNLSRYTSQFVINS